MGKFFKFHRIAKKIHKLRRFLKFRNCRKITRFPFFIVYFSLVQPAFYTQENTVFKMEFLSFLIWSGEVTAPISPCFWLCYCPKKTLSHPPLKVLKWHPYGSLKKIKLYSYI